METGRPADDSANPARPAADGAEGERRLGRPKARLCATVSLLWIFPSAGALFILIPAFRSWLQARGFLDGLRSVAFEQWVALAIVLAHLAFIGLAWHYRRTEPWREEAGWEADPDQDARG